MGRWLRAACAVAGILAVFPIGFWLYARVSSYFPRTINCRSNAVNVSGVYYPLPIDSITALKISDHKIVIDGFDAVLWPRWRTKHIQITRSLPKKYVDLKSQDLDWVVNSEYSERTFFNKRTGAEFTAQLPGGVADLYLSAYNLDSRRQLIVIASGDWKVHPNSYYGLIEVKKNAP